MASSTPPRLRVLLCEGASTSARQVVTCLGLLGHEIEICDPSGHCLARFSRFVRRLHRCPPLRDAPEEFLAFILDLVARERFDVLIPVHEQGLILSTVREAIQRHCAIALPAYADYRRAVSKAGFSQLLAAEGLAQPPTRIVSGRAALEAAIRMPCLVKSAIGTASRGVWTIETRDDIAGALAGLDDIGGWDGPVLVQDRLDGAVAHAQAIFAQGELHAAHAFRRVKLGVGGGAALKESAATAPIEPDLRRLGQALNWHGALSVDYIEHDGIAHYIDCNPRLVEPANAFFGGLDLVTALLDVSRGQSGDTLPQSRPVRTHAFMQALLGAASRGATRRALAAEAFAVMSRTGDYHDSREELTPAGLDWVSVLPAAMTALALFASPQMAHTLARRGWGAHLLTPQTVGAIDALAGNRNVATAVKETNRSRVS